MDCPKSKIKWNILSPFVLIEAQLSCGKFLSTLRGKTKFPYHNLTFWIFKNFILLLILLAIIGKRLLVIIHVPSFSFFMAEDKPRLAQEKSQITTFFLASLCNKQIVAKRPLIKICYQFFFWFNKGCWHKRIKYSSSAMLTVLPLRSLIQQKTVRIESWRQ